MSTRESYNKAIDFYRKASHLYKKIGNEDDEIYMSIQIGEAHYYLNQLDSANYYLNQAKQDFNKVNYVNLYRIYLQKAKVFRAQGKVDSAWYFLNLSYEAQIVKLEQEQRKAVAEIEESYQNEKINRQLTQQEEDLLLEKAKRNRFIVLALIMLIFTVIFIYLYVQMRKINQINQEQAEQLKNLDQAKSRFFANVSHELRTPLTLMLGPVNNLLKENNLTPKQATLLQTAADSGAKLQQLINEILNLRKLEMDKMEVHAQATLLHPFFTQYIAQFDSLAAGKNLDYTYELALDKTLSADLDQEKTRQILQNLLTNAFKYTPEHQQIKVNISLDKEILEMVVADTGRGIHAEDLPYLFDRYFQTNRRDMALEGGTGIGLALCKEYAELLGGTIQVKSTLGKGSTFRVALPLANLSRKELHLPQEAISPIPPILSDTIEEAKPLPIKKTGKPQILVVEDNPALRNHLTLLLAEKYEVVSAEHGQKAWDYLFSDPNKNTIQSIDLILSDLMMPVMDGYQLLEKLKSHDATRHIPVVMLTARAEMRDKLKALRIGINDYLLKPFEEEELLVRIENLLQNQANRILEAPSKTDTPASIPLVSKEDEQWLVEFEAFVQKNLSNSILSVPMLADQFSMSEATLFRQLKHITGLSPSQYLIEIRLEKALRLLENHSYNSISQVAYKVGYSDPNSFSRAFKRRFGKSPSKVVSV